jgi:hypothetical protein
VRYLLLGWWYLALAAFPQRGGVNQERKKSMTKNIVRKSLSILSASVLGASVLVAAPAAFAAGELKLEPAAGTLYAVPHQSEFELKLTANPGYSNSELQFLKFKVATVGGVNIAVVTGTSTVTANASSTVLVDNTETSDETSAVNASTGGIAYIGLYATDSADADNAFTASSISATVTAWVDKDQDDLVDAAEWQTSQTVTWVDSDAITTTLTMVQPVLNDAAVIARLTSTQINLAQASGKFIVDFSGPSYTEADVAGTYSAVLDRVTYSGTDTVIAGTYSANLEINDGTDVDISTVSRTVNATTVNAVAVEVLAGAHNTALASDASTIRAGSGSLVYTVTVTASGSVPIKDAKVTLTVSETAINNIEAAATISVGSTTLKNADVTDTEDIEVSGTTDADGEVSFTIAWSGLGAVTAGDPFSVEATIDGVSGGADTFTTAKAAATKLYSADVQDGSSGSNSEEQVVVAIGQPFSLTYHLVDQWGQLFKDAGYSVTATAASAATATGVFSNGVATVTFAGYDNDNKGAKAITTAITNTLGLTTTGVTDTDAEFTVFVGAPTAASTIELAGTYGTSTSKSTLNTSKTVDADARVGTATTAPSSEITDVTATVRDANGNGTRSKVTFSGTNLIFKSAAGIYKKGSITVWTDENGVADVDVSSQYAGTQVMTVTAGSATTTKSIVFASAAATTGTKWTFTAPATVAAGSTFKVVGTLTDYFGNPVQVTDTADIAVTYDGPGLVSGSLPTTTNASGQFSFWVLVGSNDKGTATITAYYDRSSDGDFTGVVAGDLDVVASTTITLGAAPASTTGVVNVGSFNGKLVVYAKNLDGKRISWKVGGNWGKAVAVGNTLNRFDRLTPRKGVTVSVNIYVDGVLTLTKSVVTR